MHPLASLSTLPPPDIGPAVRLQSVSRRFGSRTILDGIDLSVARGEFVALLGRSGCGKSTLLKIIDGLDTGAEGRVVVGASHATVFQDPRLLPWRPVWRNVLFALEGRPRALRPRALQALAEVELAERADAWPLTLSGGEAQRVALARALVRTPELLLMDEPFAALDALTRLKMQQLVERLWLTHGMAAVLVTHDVDEALLLADRVLLIENGRIAVSLSVGLDRPRYREHPHFAALRRELLGHLGVVEPSHRVALTGS